METLIRALTHKHRNTRLERMVKEVINEMTEHI